MGITSKKQKDLPPELQQVDAPEFDTIPAFDNSVRQPKSGVAIPTGEAVKDIKTFMNINKQ